MKNRENKKSYTGRSRGGYKLNKNGVPVDNRGRNMMKSNITSY